MKISRILNNNVVIVCDENQNEKVVCGKGLAYRKKNGDEINPEDINKVFVLEDKIQSRQFQKIVAEIPLKHLEVASEIIEMIKLELGKKLNDTIYITLSDHIHTAIERFLQGVLINSPMKWDVKRFYEQEYQLGLQALDIIHKEFKILLPEDEAAFIALHIVNSEMEDSDIQKVVKITKIMQEVTNIVKYTFSIEFDTESLDYYRFITHLRFFAQRLINNTTYNSDSQNDLLEIVKEKYAMSYKCAKKVSEFILRKYQYELSEEEMLYLTIHIERIIYKTN